MSSTRIYLGAPRCLILEGLHQHCANPVHPRLQFVIPRPVSRRLGTSSAALNRLAAFTHSFTTQYRWNLSCTCHYSHWVKCCTSSSLLQSVRCRILGCCWLFGLFNVRFFLCNSPASITYMNRYRFVDVNSATCSLTTGATLTCKPYYTRTTGNCSPICPNGQYSKTVTTCAKQVVPTPYQLLSLSDLGVKLLF